MVICLCSRTIEEELPLGSAIVLDLKDGILHPVFNGSAIMKNIMPDRMVLKENMVPPFGKGSLLALSLGIALGRQAAAGAREQ